MNKELFMIDEEEINDENNTEVIIVIAPSWKRVNNVITIPKKEALRIAINIISQVDLL